MSDLLRPTFEASVPMAPERVARRLDGLLRDDSAGLTGQSVRSHFLITVGRDRRHFWSPWLHRDLRADPGDPASTSLLARFSPAPSIWTGFMLTYIALFTLALISGCWAFSQWMLEQPPTMLWGVLFPGLVAGAMLWSARIGQSLARDQMRELRDAVRGVLPGLET